MGHPKHHHHQSHDNKKVEMDRESKTLYHSLIFTTLALISIRIYDLQRPALFPAPWRCSAAPRHMAVLQTTCCCCMMLCTVVSGRGASKRLQDAMRRESNRFSASFLWLFASPSFRRSPSAAHPATRTHTHTHPHTAPLHPFKSVSANREARRQGGEDGSERRAVEMSAAEMICKPLTALFPSLPFPPAAAAQPP